ncbi:MAG: SusC/RagA family TonB-linked outer membrane protein [Bacteroides sp.]
MKTTRISLLLLFFGFQTLFASVYSDSTKVSLHLKNASFKEFVRQVKQQTEFTFVYNDKLVELVEPVTLDVQGKTLSYVLDRLFAGKRVTYQIKDRTVILSSRQEKVAQSSPMKLTGQVVDKEGNPLPGASVQVKQTSIGTLTDYDGHFQLDVPDRNSLVVVSFIGYTPCEAAAGKLPKQIVLQDDVQTLQEVVVNGYQKIDRRLFTGAAAKVDAEDAKIAGVTDLGQMLEGKAAGVSVQTVSGSFGAAPKIRVRGASSIYGDSKPLWVVDGVVLEDVVDISPDDLSSGDAATLISSAVAGLNTDDIENFQILKDASATALYGARAMNGVIVVTTKRGQKGSAKVTYNGEFSMRLRPSYNNYNLMNSRDQMSVYRELEAKGWLNHAEISKQSNGGVYKKMYDLINTYNPETGEFGLANTPEARAAFLKKYEMVNTDWFDVLFANTITQNHSLSLSGGAEKTNYYFSASYYNDPGWSIADKVDRYTMNANANIDLSKKLKVGLLTAGSFRKQRAPGTVSRTFDPISGEYSRSFDINPFSYALNTSRVLRPYDDEGNLEYYRMNYADFNILNELNYNKIDIDMLDFKLQANLDYKLFKGLEYSFIGSMRYVKSTQEHKINENSNMAAAYRADETYEIARNNKYLFQDNENANSLPYVVLPKGGFYNRSDNSMLNYYLRNTLNYNNVFDEKHIVNMLFGQEIKSTDRQSSYFDGVGYQWERGGVPYIDPTYFKKMLQGGQNYFGMGNFTDRFVAFFSTASYSFMGKYTVNGTFRYDGSNRLGKSRQSRWLPTWNVSGSWNAKEENFLADVDFLSHLVLRGTYGLTASMGPATNSSLVLMNAVTDRPYLSDQETQMYISQLENSELTWEKQYETNVGFDLGLFANRINLSLDAYWRRGFDLIGLVKTSGIGGEFYKYANYADMKSHGVEFSLTTHNIAQQDFKWNTNLTFSYNKNRITKLQSYPRVMDLITDVGGPLEGYPVRGLYSFRFTGLNSDGIPTFINQDGQSTVTDIDFQSNNISNLKYEGPIDPTVTGGLGNTLSYKGLKLNLFLTYQAGNKVRLYPSFKAVYTDLNAMPKEFFDRWIVAGDEQYTQIPVILSQVQYNTNYSKTYNAYNYSDCRVADGSFVRLKEVSITYDLPKKVLEWLTLSNASIKLQGSNLWLIYSDKKLNGQDPEFIGSGGVALPVPKQLTLTLKVGI